MNEKNSLVSGLLAVAKEWQKIAMVKECKREFERGHGDNNIDEAMPMETESEKIESSEENESSGKQNQEPDLQLEVYEDKEYDIEEVKYWNFVAKKRAPKPDVIRTLIYKVPETTALITKTTAMGNQRVTLTKANAEILITPTMRGTANSITPTTRNRLNLTALDMAHYNSNRNKQKFDYDQLDILKSNPIGSYSQQGRGENKFQSSDKRTLKRLPDEIQPLKSIDHDLNANEQMRANMSRNTRLSRSSRKSSNEPQVVIEIEEPASLSTRSRIQSRNGATPAENNNTNNNNNSNSSTNRGKRSSEAYHLRQAKRRSINYNEDRGNFDIYNFCDSNNDIDDADMNSSNLRDSSQDNDTFMLNYNELNSDDSEDDKVHQVNKKLEETDKDFDIRLERRKLMKNKNKAMRLTTNENKPKGRKKSENIYSKVYKTTTSSKFDESIPDHSDLNLPDDVRVTRRLSLRRLSINRASVNSGSDLQVKKDDDEESDSSYKINRGKRSINRKDSISSSDVPSVKSGSKQALRYSRSDTQNTDDTDEIIVLPRKKYRSYLVSVELKREVYQNTLEKYKREHNVNFKQCSVSLERVRVSKQPVNDEVDEKQEQKEELKPVAEVAVVVKEAEVVVKEVPKVEEPKMNIDSVTENVKKTAPVQEPNESSTKNETIKSRRSIRNKK